MYVESVLTVVVLKTIRIRTVPEDLHRKLEARAAEIGLTLSDYLLSEFQELAERPTLQEVLNNLKQRESIVLDEDPATTIRRHRDAE